jgi:eight-cysteine-cluster-containing protein
MDRIVPSEGIDVGSIPAERTSLLYYTISMEMKTSSLIILAIVLAIIAGVLMKISSVAGQYRGSSITSYEECVAAGNPVMESYPTQCRTPDGRTFVNPAQVEPPPQQSQQYVQNGCAIGGCSGEICGEASEADNLVSTCIYKEEFQCYKSARCERQTTGKCGWTLSADTVVCLESLVDIEANL